MEKKRIVILGAGPAGLGAAYRLAQTGRAQATVLEMNPQPGGNAGSFELDGVYVDFGSHRLHPATDPEVMADIRSLLGEDFKDRPRHGRIRLKGRWIHFPLKPVDLALRLPPSFAAGVGLDAARKVMPKSGNGTSASSFAGEMEKGLGKTVFKDFYGPYAWKIWGVDPENLSAIQARRRVKAGSLSKVAKKVLSAVPGLKPPGSGRFFYPRMGFGQISQAYFQAAQELGARFEMRSRVQAVESQDSGGFRIVYEQDGQAREVLADQVWSTIPITALARSLQPAPPSAITEAASRIDYRAMILIYLVLEQDQFTEFDAHYFPSRDIPITRLSEPKNYSGTREPAGRTVLCAELPCSPEDLVWNQTESELGDLVCRSLEIAGIPVQAPVSRVVVRKLRHAYPIYPQGYEAHFNRLDAWIGQVEGLLSFGRQGLFAHDNTHHALFMAYSAVKCLDDAGRFDRERWQEYRKVFETHVVED